MSASGPATPADQALFPGFRRERIRTRETEIHAVVGGLGPPVLLLHGYILPEEAPAETLAALEPFLAQ